MKKTKGSKLYNKTWKLYKRNADNIIEEVEYQIKMSKPNLAEIEEAFHCKFPNEKLRDINYTIEEDRTVLTIHSDLPPTRAIKTRTYAHYPGQTYQELFEKTASLVD